MCIGIPMQIVETRGTSALCRYQGEESLIDMMLVGEQAIGSWILAFLGTAREVLTPEAAQQISDALEAMQLALLGDASIDHLFADLVAREPQLPEFLKI